MPEFLERHLKILLIIIILCHLWEILGGTLELRGRVSIHDTHAVNDVHTLMSEYLD